MSATNSESVARVDASRNGATDELDDAVRTLLERYLARLDEHVETLVARIQEQIVEFRAVPPAEIGGSMKAILSVVLARPGTPEANADQIAALDEVARQSAAEGFPLEALTRSIQLVAREVHRTIAADAQARGIDGSAVVCMYDSAWQFTNDAAATIAAINNDVAVEFARRDNDRRADFLRGVLYGGIAPSRIRAEASLFGLDPARQYHPIRARPASQRQEEALTLAIRRTGSTVHHRAVLALLEGELVGLAPERPEVEDGLLVAVGALCDLETAREAFQTTRAALDAAAGFGRTGVVALGELGPLPLVFASDDLGDMLEREHFGPLEEERQGGLEVEETVRTLLEHDQNVEEVAQALHVHGNTVRYRLARFRELTALDIRRTDHLVIAWWLLARRRARRQAR
jgi:hypothetical protein